MVYGPLERQSTDTSRYNLEEYTYPYDLFDKEEYGGNYVLFFININESSKLARNNRNNSNFFVEDTAYVDINRLNSNLGRTGIEGVGAGTIFTTALAGAILGRTGGFVGGLIAGTTGEVVLKQAGEKRRQQKRLKSAIALHIPHNLKIEYKTNWEELDTAVFTGIVDSIGAGKKLYNNLQSSNEDDTIEELFKKNDLSGDLGLLGGLFANIGLRVPFTGDALSVSTGLAANPRKEQIFRGIGFREFSFDYQFFARNKEEALAIKQIIYNFKYHMHPEYHTSKRNFLFYYPSEFDISYYTGHKENEILHRHPSAVLTNMRVDYAPNNVFNVIDDEFPDEKGRYVSGMPTQINVSLDFKELAIITKDEIEQGY